MEVVTMPKARGYDASHFAVELDGRHVGFPIAVSGGEVFADVVEEAPVGGTVDKHLGPRRYEPIVIEAGLSMETAWFDAIGDMLEGQGAALSGAIVMLDFNYAVVRRLEWKAGVITEVGFPKADTSDTKTAGRLRVVIAPQATSLTFGGGAYSGRGMIGTKPKSLLPSNFRFTVNGLESACTRISQVSAITVHRRDTGVITLDDVEFLVTAADAAPFSAWFDGLVDGKDTERSGVLAFLDPAFTNDLIRLELRALGVFRVAMERLQNGSEVIVRVRVHMYCEGVTWKRPAGTEAASKPPAAEADVASQRNVERLAAALLDAVGATPRRPATKETIAARLLAGSEGTASEETPRERGLAAGRSWAGEEARLDELEDLAGVAVRDEWSALALGDDHTLRAFLGTRGDLPEGDAAVGDLARDEFTTGLLAGILEIHREVAPLIEGPVPVRR
jgi:hypothetical protein